MRRFDLEGVSQFSDRGDRRHSRGAIRGPVIDVGTGTGIGARLIAQRVSVIGIDPGIEMLRAGSERSIAGTAEQLPARTAATDLLTAFNAFHWFKPRPFFDETRRVLRTGGRLALVWNDWDLSDEFTAAFVKLMRSAAGDFPPEDREAEVAPLYETDAVSDIRRHEFENVHRLDRQLLPMRLQSMSYIPPRIRRYRKTTIALLILAFPVLAQEKSTENTNPRDAEWARDADQALQCRHHRLGGEGEIRRVPLRAYGRQSGAVQRTDVPA